MVKYNEHGHVQVKKKFKKTPLYIFLYQYFINIIYIYIKHMRR